jgi:periplasmic protein TonB
VFLSTSPAARPPSRFLFISAIAQAVAVLLMVTIHFSPALPAIASRTARVMLLAPYLKPPAILKRHDAPRPRAHPPVPAPVPLPAPIALAEPAPQHVAREFHAPVPRTPVLATTTRPTKIELAAIPIPEPARVAIPTIEPLRIEHVTTSVKTGTFGGASTSTALPVSALAKPAGFSGIDVSSNTGVSTRARSGSVGGFSDGATVSASRGSGGTISGKTISSGGFGDTTVATNSAAVRKSDAPAATTPVEILSKPRPAYTAEARSLQLEGEVLLEIRFAASGNTRCLRVIRGLGHGLDESAIAAAREIRFRPARQDGSTIDSDAIVHIQFQLAY